MTRRAQTWALWFGVLAGAFVVMFAARTFLDKAHVAILCLLVVLGGSAAGGRALGIALAIAAFLGFNFFFLPPFHTFAVGNPFDWLVLFAFLVTGIVAAQLLYRAQAEAAAARSRTEEVDRLAALGAETLSVGRAEEALSAVTRVIRTTLSMEDCRVHFTDYGTEALAWVAERGIGAATTREGTMQVAPSRGVEGLTALLDHSPPPSELFWPLSVRSRTVGVLRLVNTRGITLDAAQRRFLDALAYYAALGVERVKLTAEAERAAALQEAARLKDALLATVSHDIRTPLTTIRARAHDIAQDGDERAVLIEEESLRLNRFVADLLDMSRVSAGAVSVDIELNVAEDLLGAVLQRISGLPGADRVHASLDAEEPLLAGHFDFAQSLRILGNLLENALSHSPGDGAVELSARREGDRLVFVVADRGPGIPAEDRANIFEAFHRPRGAQPDAGHAGLGLAIANGLAVAQGGELVFMPRDGGGSLFILSLPAADISDAFVKS